MVRTFSLVIKLQIVLCSCVLFVKLKLYFYRSHMLGLYLYYGGSGGGGKKGIMFLEPAKKVSENITSTISELENKNFVNV